MSLVVPLCCLLFLCDHNLCASVIAFVLFAHKCLPVGLPRVFTSKQLCICIKVHKLSFCLCEQVFTWVDVKLAFHSLGNALQFDSLQGAVSMDGGGQAAQRLPDETSHLPHCEDL